MVTADDVSEQARLREEVNRISEQSATANEELQSTNEELETTVEELQSINAELGTMNAELEQRTADLNRLDQYHHSVVDALEQGLFVLDETFTVRTWNRAAAAMWGLKAEDALNRDFFSLPIRDVTSLLREPAAAVLARRSAHTVEGVPHGRDGSSRRTTVELHPLVAGDGAPIGILGIAEAGR
ncbi:MAG: PAS domain-containing protein [Deltaproteobacteria bacterium]|nr:MAG: PAS domain-containing protein [Deltaproteobacteria bacterium]